MVEGPSDVAFLCAYLPRAFAELYVQDLPKPKNNLVELKCVSMKNKPRMNKKLKMKLHGWSPDTTFIILQDKDDEDCRQTKQKLITLCKAAKKDHLAKVRIACRQLENWYLGDIGAVEVAYGNIPRLEKNKLRGNVDDKHGSMVMEKIINGKYQKMTNKIGVGRTMGKYMSINYHANKSHSFRIFCQSVDEAIKSFGLRQSGRDDGDTP